VLALAGGLPIKVADDMVGGGRQGRRLPAGFGTES
jgi:hypothetical protein